MLLLCQNISKINKQEIGAAMHNHSRSKDHHTGLKSKHGSIETKLQSTVKSISSIKKSTPSKPKAKPKPKPHKSDKKIIKSADKLNDLMTKITKKLSSFEKQSVLATPSTSSNLSRHKSQILSSISCSFVQEENKNSHLASKQNKSTALLIQKIKQQKDLTVHHQVEQEEQKKQDNSLLNLQLEYQGIFQSALSRPHELVRIVMRKRKGIVSWKPSLIDQFREFKKKQCENWSNINQQLKNYLLEDKKQIQQKQHKKISDMLTKQGMTNYRWLQILDKVSVETQEEMKNEASAKKKKKKLIKQQEIRSNQSPINRIHLEPQQTRKFPIFEAPNLKQSFSTIKQNPIHPIVQANPNWEKYIWDDEGLSTSDLQCNSIVYSDMEYLHINTEEVIQEVDQIQENVDLVLDWILDEFVMELARKLDRKVVFGLDKKPESTGTRQYDEVDHGFLESINQICDDSLRIRALMDGSPTQQYYIDALKEVVLQNPKYNEVEAVERLVKIICNRQVEVQEIFVFEEVEEKDFIKMSFLYELEEIIWEGLVMEEVCKLWMG